MKNKIGLYIIGAIFTISNMVFLTLPYAMGEVPFTQQTAATHLT